MAALASERRLLMLVAAAMTLMMALATWSWTLGTDHASPRLLTGAVMLALWGFVESPSGFSSRACSERARA